MLGKLLKYDLKTIFKPLLIFYGIMIFLAILGRLLHEFSNSALSSAIYEFCSGAIPGFMVGAILNNLINIWRLFRYDFYGDHAYLMRTLPVSSQKLYLSKFLTILITTFATITITIFSLFFIYGISETLANFSNIINSMSHGTLFVALICLLIYLEVVFATQIGILGNILGHYTKSNKSLFSIIFSFVLYVFSSTLILLVLFVFSLFNSDIMKIFTESTFNAAPSILCQIFIIATITYLTFITVTYYLNQKLLARGVDVE